jgi:hypothetical protein
MMCKYPYIKDRSISRLETRVNKELRQKATPYPCGQCLHCRINQGRVWQHRIMLEAMMHPDTIWVTLTYNEESLPRPAYVNKEHIQKFLKRLRRVTPKFRYFIVGEYGEKTFRPHYHCCFFGLSMLYAQEIFEKWGMCDREGIKFGEITEVSARYTVGYTVSKLTKQQWWKKYGATPEFMLSSKRNGGIGYPAIVEIAKRFRSSKWFESRVIRDLRRGKIDQPLGRYLTVKLSELLDIPKSKLDEEYWKYQEEIFENHEMYMGDAVKYYEVIVDQKLIDRTRQEKLRKIWKKERIL